MNRQKFFSMIGKRNHPNKYRAIRVEDVVDGKVMKFASKSEHRRFKTLQWMKAANLISELKLQVPFKCEVNGKLICTYLADFTYVREGKYVVEDVKGWATREYRLKKKLVEALWGIEIQEVKG